MAIVDPAFQQIQTEPSALVLEIHLVPQRFGPIRAGGVFGLNELGRGVDLANSAHGERGGETLMVKGANEGLICTRVRIPVPVERAEPRSRERFVHWRVAFDPRVTSCD